MCSCNLWSLYTVAKCVIDYIKFNILIKSLYFKFCISRNISYLHNKLISTCIYRRILIFRIIGVAYSLIICNSCISGLLCYPVINNCTCIFCAIIRSAFCCHSTTDRLVSALICAVCRILSFIAICNYLVTVAFFYLIRPVMIMNHIP